MNNDYSSKDFTSIYEDLLAIVEASTTLWNPRYSTEADPGVVILKAMALLEDKSNYRFDMSRAQAYLDTVSDRTSAYDLLAMLGYIMQGSRAAEGFITVRNTSDKNYTIPQFSVVTNPTKEVLFFTKEEVTVSAGEAKSISVQAGTIFQVVKQGISEFTLKDIDEKGRLFLGKTNLAQNGVHVKSSVASTKWIYLDYVLLQESSTYYTVGTSETGEMYVQFPNNYASLIGNDKLTVYATYTDGANSNIAKNVLSTFSDNQKDASGEQELLSIFTVSQTEDIYSGQDEETIDHAIQTYYETKDVCSTLITAQDFTTALRYLLISNVRVFSNVLIETPQTKTKRMMTSQNGVSYIQLVQPKDLDYNKIDVLPTKFSTEYYQSFKPYLNYNYNTYPTEKSLLENRIDEKLIGQKALPIKINIAGYDKPTQQEEWVVDEFIQPIFATFSPAVYVYLRDSSIGQQVIAREAIKRYFHTTYNMKNLSAGKGISETTVAKDIKSLSTNILDVVVLPFEYSMKQFRDSYLSSQSADFSASGSLKDLSEELKLSILADSVLSGDVPLFRFSNRQNSYSKTNSLYSQLSAEEQVLPIPFGATSLGDMTTFPNGCNLFATAILGNDYNSTRHTLTADEMIQIRRPVFVKKDSWGQGMQWTYSLQAFTDSSPSTTRASLNLPVESLNLPVYVSLNGDTGLSAPPRTNFQPASDIAFEGDLTSFFSGDNVPTFDSSKNITTFSRGLLFTVTKEDLILKGGYLPLLNFNWVDGVTPTYYLQQPGSVIPTDSTYIIRPGETLTIRKSSTSEDVATYEEGDAILLENVSITRAPTVSEILSSAMTTISLMEPKIISKISSDYVYFLCRNSSSPELSIGRGSSYTLEEGEYFIYADAGVTEYVTLGPGTEIFATSADVVLKSHNNYDINSILPSDFEPLSSDLEAKFYEITTFIEGDTIRVDGDIPLSTLFPISVNQFKPIWRYPPTGSYEISVQLSGETTASPYTISSTDYSIRHLAVLKTLSEGYAVALSTSFAFAETENLPENPPPPTFRTSDSSTSQVRLYSSIALSGFAGSLLTNLPFRFVVATMRLEEREGKYIENLSAVSGSKVQGLRTSLNSTVPSPYDLTISYRGALQRSTAQETKEKVVASFNIPLSAVTQGCLFRFRHLSGTEDKGVTFKITLNDIALKDIPYSAQGQAAHPLSFTDYVFVIPKNSTAAGTQTLSIVLTSSSTDYPATSDSNRYQLQAAIEDISILHDTYPFDPQLDISYTEDPLPKQLGGSDETSQAYKLLAKISTASSDAVAAKKTAFNWLYYSLDRLSAPLDPLSFFLSAHPKNSKVFPLYIEDTTKIKFPQRG